MVANILHQFVLVTTTIIAGYAAIVLFLSFPAPQRWAVYLHWINFPFFTDFDTPEYFGFGHVVIEDNKGRNILITAEDGTNIGAWHFVPSHYYMGQQLRFRPKDMMQDIIYDLALGNPDYETVIYFHGNAGNRAAPWRVDLYKKIGDKFPNVNIIAIDYRGFGNSEGTPSEEGLRMDAKATWEWLMERGVPNDKISIIGHSLGTGIATSLAYELSRMGSPPKALILKAAYSSLPTLLFEYRALKFIPFFAPINLLPPYVNCPILIIYGAVDFEIPGHNSQKLFHRAIYGLETEIDYSDEWLVNDPNIKNVTVEHEVSVYQHRRNPNVKLAVLTYAHHNNVGYFDYVFEAMGHTAKWVPPGEVPLVEV
ncbi:Alpha/Beta hydrolase protein [Umbelopsis sp. PMI_123]|nr:Alpha/Beta hydrolase protein [Umbelopsis sp. PMI_123]